MSSHAMVGSPPASVAVAPKSWVLPSSTRTRLPSSDTGHEMTGAVLSAMQGRIRYHHSQHRCNSPRYASQSMHRRSWRLATANAHVPMTRSAIFGLARCNTPPSDPRELEHKKISTAGSVVVPYLIVDRLSIVNQNSGALLFIRADVRAHLPPRS